MVPVLSGTSDSSSIESARGSPNLVWKRVTLAGLEDEGGQRALMRAEFLADLRRKVLPMPVEQKDEKAWRDQTRQEWDRLEERLLVKGKGATVCNLDRLLADLGGVPRFYEQLETVLAQAAFNSRRNNVVMRLVRRSSISLSGRFNKLSGVGVPPSIRSMMG